MAALTQDVNCSLLGKPIYGTFSANGADTFYQGALVFTDTSGGVQVVADQSAADSALGFVTKQQVITAAAQSVEVMIWGFIWLPIGTAISAADEGDFLIYDSSAGVTDNPADLVSGLDTTKETVIDTLVGRILRVTATQMLVYISPGLTGDIWTTGPGWGG